MTNKITLHWIEKFKSLMHNSDLDDKDVILRFGIFCEEEEKKINKRFEEK